MKALAEFVMRGRKPAILVVMIAAVLPMLFPVSAAAGSLVLLRRGLADAASVVGWALLPAMTWWLLGEPRPLLVIVGTLVLAQVLRGSISWLRVVLTSVCVGVLFAAVLGQVQGELIASTVTALQQVLPEMLGEAYSSLTAIQRERLVALLPPLLTGIMAALLQLLCLMCLMVARYWQAVLYNPGGFARELQALRIPAPVAAALLAAVVLAPYGGSDLLMLAPLLSLPLLLAGVALVHALVAARRIAVFWLAGMYVSLVLFMQLTYPLLVLLAVVDSVLDFRRGSPPES